MYVLDIFRVSGSIATTTMGKGALLSEMNQAFRRMQSIEKMRNLMGKNDERILAISRTRRRQSEHDIFEEGYFIGASRI
jgi:hypothetical protein